MPEEVNNSAALDVRSDEDLDKLADDSAKATNRERPMTAEPEKPAKAESDSFEFPHAGKTVKGTREQILKWAQQGYDYPQRAQKLNQEKAKWDADRQKWESEWGVYKQIDDYAKSNREWWETIQRSFQTRGTATPGQVTPTNGQDPYAPKFQILEQKLSQLEPLVQKFVEKEQILHQQAEDDKLDQDIRSIRESHANLDWQTLDENGQSLETRVLEHAQKNGISTFRAAFRDLLHDELVTKAESAGKLAVAKGIQNRTKLGVLGESPTASRNVPQRNRDIRKTSYEELAEEAKEEIRQMSGRS